MRTLFIDCPTGLAGDMLLAALLDLGVPREVVETPLSSMGLGDTYTLKVEKTDSFGLRGLKVFVDGIESEPINRCWGDIRSLINNAPWEESLRKKVLAVFKSLAEAEALVHGCDVEEVHFHEL